MQNEREKMKISKYFLVIAILFYIPQSFAGFKEIVAKCSAVFFNKKTTHTVQKKMLHAIKNNHIIKDLPPYITNDIAQAIIHIEKVQVSHLDRSTQLMVDVLLDHEIQNMDQFMSLEEKDLSKIVKKIELTYTHIVPSYASNYLYKYFKISKKEYNTLITAFFNIDIRNIPNAEMAQTSIYWAHSTHQTMEILDSANIKSMEQLLSLEDQKLSQVISKITSSLLDDFVH